MDRGKVWDGGAVWPAMGCRVAGEGGCVHGGQACGGCKGRCCGGCAVMPRQPYVSAMGKSKPVGLSAGQAIKTTFEWGRTPVTKY
jgi:hypothetical protein